MQMSLNLFNKDLVHFHACSWVVFFAIPWGWQKNESFHVLSKTIASIRSFQKQDEQLRAREKIATLSRKEQVSQVLTLFGAMSIHMLKSRLSVNRRLSFTKLWDGIDGWCTGLKDRNSCILQKLAMACLDNYNRGGLWNHQTSERIYKLRLEISN